MISNFPRIDYDIENALTYYALEQGNNNDFIVLTSGHEKCKSDKRIIGPLQHGYYVLHYVHSGKGYLKMFGNDGKETVYTVSKGQLFLLYPNVNISYRPDVDDPWEYSWICFCGSVAFNHANRLTDKTTPIINLKNHEKTENSFKKLLKLNEYPHSKDLKITSIAMEIFSEIIEQSEKKDKPNLYKNYIKDCLIYIQNNYKNPDLSVMEISRHLNINEKYLSRLFTAALQIPLTKYITLLRLQKACSLLNDDDKSINEISDIVGYSDPLYFSRIFTKHIGISPSKWKKQNDATKNKI